jgi:diguanylate cyclase (GGDEF)-like protein
MMCKDGTWKWTLCRGAVFSKNSQSLAERVIGTHVDISAYKPMEISLRNSLDTQKSAFESIAHPVALLDKQGYVLHTNAAWKGYARSIGYGRQLALSETLPGEMLGILPGTCTEVQQQVSAGIRSVIDGSKAEFHIEYSHPSLTGERIVLLEATPVVDGLARVLVSHHDITASVQMRDQSVNGARFYQVAQAEFTRATRYRQPLMVLVLTLNYGFVAGKEIDANTAAIARDKVLQLSREELRISDAIGSIGGDGYAVLLPNTVQDGGEALALRIIDKVLSAPIIMAGDFAPVTVSIGASSLNGDANFAALLGRADSASRVSQQRGGNRLTVDTAGILCLWGDTNEGDGLPVVLDAQPGLGQ